MPAADTHRQEPRGTANWGWGSSQTNHRKNHTALCIERPEALRQKPTTLSWSQMGNRTSYT